MPGGACVNCSSFQDAGLAAQTTRQTVRNLETGDTRSLVSPHHEQAYPVKKQIIAVISEPGVWMIGSRRWVLSVNLAQIQNALLSVTWHLLTAGTAGGPGIGEREAEGRTS